MLVCVWDVCFRSPSSCVRDKPSRRCLTVMWGAGGGVSFPLCLQTRSFKSLSSPICLDHQFWMTFQSLKNYSLEPLFIDFLCFFQDTNLPHFRPSVWCFKFSIHLGCLGNWHFLICLISPNKSDVRLNQVITVSECCEEWMAGWEIQREFLNFIT